MQPSDTLSKEETEKRFMKLVGIALKTKPKTQKMMGRKGVPAQRKSGKIKPKKT